MAEKEKRMKTKGLVCVEDALHHGAIPGSLMAHDEEGNGPGDDQVKIRG